MLRIEGMHHPVLWTCEDLWRDNKRGVSSIPAGTYRCDPHGWGPKSPFRFKRVWQVVGVKGRSAILIHPGNDHTDTEGCILVGKGISNSGITDSVSAVEYLRNLIGEKPFTLVVKSDIID